MIRAIVFEESQGLLKF